MNKDLFNCLMFVISLVLLIAASDRIKAEETDVSLLLGGVSYHFLTEDYTNSVHNVVVVDYDSVVVGYMKNSYGNDSFVLGYDHTLAKRENYDFGLYLGAVRGYDYCFGKYAEGVDQEKVAMCPMVAAYLVINTDTILKPQFTLFGDALVASARYDF